MDFTKFYARKNEKPLDNIVDDGGFCSIFRTIACIGDSLSSGELESMDESGNRGWHDYYEDSWGQYIARTTGAKVYNFSKGGMTAKEYWNTFADKNDFWDPDKKCQCYIIALGVNDILNKDQEIGSPDDIDMNDFNNNADTFAGYYGRIIQRIKKLQPKARVFLMTMVHEYDESDEEKCKKEKHAELLHKMAEVFEYTYVIDFEKYIDSYDEQFKKNFYLGGHLNNAGYYLTAKMTMSYIDYIIRNNFEDFSQVGFIGRGVHNCGAKW